MKKFEGIMKKRKKSLLAVAILMTTFAGGAPQAVAGDQTTIKITGTVKADTCTIKDSASVTLPDVSIRDFKGVAGTEAGSVPVSLVFTDCGSSTVITTKISGKDDTDVLSGDVFKNTQESGAKGIGVVLYDTNGNKFKTDGSSIAKEINVMGGGASTSYTAKYISTGPKITSGPVEVLITATFSYK
ncbi:fimbrial protein [Enterobacter cancerogenus]|uniref:fimbrial protein n=1 Tax=Enterobacter cancerogenus TaxID=69218 RepID=UPI00382039C0